MTTEKFLKWINSTNISTQCQWDRQREPFLTLTASNYENTARILQDRFGKTQQIITAHLDELIKITPCHNDRPTSLRYVFDQISVHTRGLASLDVFPEQYGSLLISIIMSKLPNKIRLHVARNSTDEVWTND